MWILFVISFLNVGYAKENFIDCRNGLANACNLRPTSILNVRESINLTPMKYSFDGTSSYDPDGEIVKYEWFINDNLVSTNKLFDYQFKTSGRFKVELRVIDNNMVSSTSRKNLTINKKIPGALEEFFQDDYLAFMLGDFNIDSHRISCQLNGVSDCVLDRVKSNIVSMPLKALSPGAYEIQFSVKGIALKHRFTVKRIPSTDFNSSYTQFNDAYTSIRNTTPFYYTSDYVRLSELKNNFSTSLDNLTLAEKSDVMSYLNERLGTSLVLADKSMSEISLEKISLGVLKSNAFVFCAGMGFGAIYTSRLALEIALSTNPNYKSLALYSGLTVGLVTMAYYCRNFAASDIASIRYLDEVIGTQDPYYMINFKHGVRKEINVIGRYKNISIQDYNDVKGKPHFVQKIVLGLRLLQDTVNSIGGFILSPIGLSNYPLTVQSLIDGDFITDVRPENHKFTVKSPFSNNSLPSFEFSLQDLDEDEVIDFNVHYDFEGVQKTKTLKAMLEIEGWRPWVGYQRQHLPYHYFFHSCCEEVVTYSWYVNGSPAPYYPVPYTFEINFPAIPNTIHKIKLHAVRADGVEGVRSFDLIPY